MESLDYRDEVIDILTNMLDINVEDARELCDKHKAIMETGQSEKFHPKWAASRIIEIEA